MPALCRRMGLKGMIFLVALLGGISSTQAQTLITRDYAVELTATVQETPPRVTLNWFNNEDGQQYMLQRKLKTATNWQSSVVLSSTASSYADTNVILGGAYEYGVTKYPLSAYAQSGYIYAGIRAPLIESRGKLILIVDNTFSTALTNELARLQQDLIGDGWTILRHDVARTSTVPTIKNIIRTDYLSDTTAVRTVFLFGHIAVPYSGNYNADDHTDHTGAWVADTFYADIDNDWTDSSVRNTKATRPENWNIPGDGKYDQSVIPSDVELEVGRVDLANLPAFLPRTEQDLLRSYLDKDHDFRHGMLTAQRRALLFDGFGESGGEAYAASGWRNFAPFFGTNGTTEVWSDQFFPAVSAEDYLWSYVAGGGDANYMDCYFVGNTGDFANYNVQTIFTMVFGSYWGDWDATNDFFRATLASGDALTTAWAGRPHWFFHHMALGETIGYSTRLTQNNSSVYAPNLFNREVHISLLGDPTLRMHIVKPPSSLAVATNTGSIALSWAASPDNNLLGYHVYRANSANGPFTRLTASPVVSASYTDAAPSGTYTYMVRALKFESSPSGTYTNLSQGIFINASVSASNTPVNLAQMTLQSGFASFQCRGNIGQRFAIERSTNLIQWLPLVTNTLSTTNLSFTDTNRFYSRACVYRTKTLP